MLLPAIKRIILEQDAIDSVMARNLLSSLKAIPVLKVSSVKGELAYINPCNLPVKIYSDDLVIMNYKGRLFKPCPGTREYICCGYHIMNFGTGCPIGCTYCILQAYFNHPGLRVFANVDDMLKEFQKNLDQDKNRFFRVGTGEFTDSLILDPFTKLSDILVPFFAGQKRAILELKTKTTNIDRLLRMDPGGKTIVSWSLNSGYMAAHEEGTAPGIKKRLIAARKCEDAGYRLSFHFDPIAPHKGWKDDYARTIDMIFEKIKSPDSIAWISLGSFRFMPDLKSIMKKNHPHTRLLYGEFIQGLDKKMRYFKETRIEVYSFIADRIRGYAPDPGLYMCMESEEVWRRVMGWVPCPTDGLAHYLDRRVFDI